MNLVYIANSSIPSRSANSVHVMKMCEALGRSGFDLTLVVPNNADRDYSGADPYKFYGVAPSFKIRRIKIIKRTPQGMLHYFYAGLALLRYGMGRRSVIFTRSLLVACLGLLLGKRILLEMHDSPLMVSRMVCGLFVKWRLFGRPGFLGLIVISNPLKELFVAMGWPAEKIRVLADAVSLEPFRDIGSPKWGKSRYNLGYVGSLCQGRGVELICELARRDSRNDYLVYGGEEEEIRSWKEKEAGRPNLFFRGHVNNAEIPKRLEEMDILLMPYQRKISVSGNFGDTSKWASPMKMFEYMASGRPVVSSEIPVLKEVLTHGETCLFVDPEKVEEWESAIKKLVGDEDLALRLGANARRTVEHGYTWEKRAERVREMLDDPKIG